MPDIIVATHGGLGEGTTESFEYCGTRRGGPGGSTDGQDIIQVWLNRYGGDTPPYGDYADVTVVARSDSGPSSDQFTWTASPGGAHITHYGDDDGGSGTLGFPNEFYDSGYYNITIDVNGEIDFDYCFTVLVNGIPIPSSTADEDWHVGGPHW